MKANVLSRALAGLGLCTLIAGAGLVSAPATATPVHHVHGAKGCGKGSCGDKKEGEGDGDEEEGGEKSCGKGSCGK